jgi:hypothetical protein
MTMNPIDRSIFVALLRIDFRAFVEKCFSHLNPGQTYHDNWHVGVIGHALAQCLSGSTKRLIILLPPRNLKSTIVSIAWPAFVLGKFPSMKFVCASYGQELANQLSNDTRSIMNSDWYREVFPETLISPLKDTQGLFATTKFGGRMATSIGGVMTGFGGDIVIIDDPQKPQEMEHDSSRHKARACRLAEPTSYCPRARAFKNQIGVGSANPLSTGGGVTNAGVTFASVFPPAIIRKGIPPVPFSRQNSPPLPTGIR